MRYVTKNLVWGRALSPAWGFNRALVLALLAAVVVGCNSGSSTAPFNAPAPVVPPVTGQRAPVITGVPSATAPANLLYDFQPTASDPDGDPLTYQKDTTSILPMGVTFSTSTGRLTGTPVSAQVGMTFSNIIISVSDGMRTASLAPFAITVTAAPNRPPTISGVPNTAVQAGVPYVFQAVGADPDGAAGLVYSIEGAPVWADTTNFATTGRLVGTPGTQHIGPNFSTRIIITVSDGALTASLPTFSILVTATANRPPVISGTPPATAAANVEYNFMPVASDPDGNPLTYSIQGPPWLVLFFETTTGRIRGTPTAANAGTYANIVITVSDGQASATLTPFSIRVTQVGTGTAVLTWTPPTKNVDLTDLVVGPNPDDLSAYKIYYGTNPSTLVAFGPDIPAATLTSTVSGLDSGTWYFAMTAKNVSGVESARTNVASKVVP